MKRFAVALMALVLPCSLAAQQAHVPIIPDLIGTDHGNAQVSVIVDRGLTSNRNLRNSLRAARNAMHRGDAVSASRLRALANAGDGLAAQRYVRLLLAEEATPDPSDLAFYSAIAVGTGRIWTLRTMIAAMHKLDPAREPRERIRRYIRVLYPHAWAGNTLALQAVLDFNGEGRLFGPLSDKTRARIAVEAAKHGDGRIELSMAVALLERTRAVPTSDPKDLNLARQLLEKSATSAHLAVATSAQNLLLLMQAQETGARNGNSS